MGLVQKKLREIIKLPKVVLKLEKLYYRGDRLNKPFTKLKCIKINKTMGWCNDIKDKANYNKLVDTKKKTKYEKLYRKDFKYDLIIPIKYNWQKKNLEREVVFFYT